MEQRIRCGAGLAAIAIAAAWFGAGANPSFAAVPTQSRQPAVKRSAWSWLKSRIDRLQGESQRQAASTAAENETPGRLGWTFDDIDVQTALRRIERFGFTAPVDVEGRATIKIRVGVPWRHAFSARDYRLYASIDSPRLTIAGFEVNDCHAALSYVDGVLKLANLRFEPPDFSAAGAPAVVRGGVEMQLEPRGDLAAQLNFERLALAPLAAAAAAAQPQAGIDQAALDRLDLGGAAAGRADAKVAIDRFRDLAAWRVDARLKLADLRAFATRRFDLEAAASLDRGVARLDHLAVHMQNSAALLAGDATLQLQPAGLLHFRLHLDELELATLFERDPEPARWLSGRVGGNIAATAPLERIGEPAAWEGRGRLSAADVRALGLPPLECSAEVRAANGRLSASNLAADSDLVHVDGGGELALSGDFAYAANVRLTSSRLSRLNQLAPDFQLPIEVGGRLGAAASVRGALRSRSLSAKGGVNARDVRIADVQFDRLEFRYSADQRRLQLHPLSAEMSGGRLNASAVIPLDAQGELRAGVRWSELSLAPLLAPLLKRFGDSTPPFAGRTSGTLQLRAPGETLAHVPPDWKQWTGQAKIDFDRLNIPADGAAALAGGRGDAQLRLTAGSLRLEAFKAGWGPTTVDGTAELSATAPYAFKAQLALSNLDLALAGRLPAAVRAPAAVAGRAGVSAKLSGALEPRRIAGQGAFIAKQLKVDRVRVDSVSANFAFDDRQLRLSRLAAQLYGGQLQGSLAAALDPRAASRAELEWRDVQLGRLLADWQAAPNNLAGRSQGKLQLSADRDSLRDLTTWRGDVSLVAEDFRLWGWGVRRAALAADLDAGVLRMTKLAVATYPTAGREAMRFSASGRLNLAAPHDFQAQFKLNGFDLGRLKTLPANIRPPAGLSGQVDAAGEAQGTLEPLRVTGEGAISSAGMTVAETRIDSFAARLKVDETAVEFDRLDVRLYEGRIGGEIRIPLDRKTAGRIALAAEHVDVGKLAAAAARWSTKVSGFADAKLHAEIPPGRLHRPDEWLTDATLDAPEIFVNSLQIGKLHAQGDFRRGSLDYQADGELLDGRWKLAGLWHRADGRRAAENRGAVQLDGARLSRLSEMLSGRGAGPSFAGTASARLNYRHDAATGLPMGQGHLEIAGLRKGDVLLSERIAGVIRATPDAITLDQLGGSLVGGRLRASGEWYLSPDRRSRFHVSLHAVDLNDLLQGRLPAEFRIIGGTDVDVLVFYGQRRPVQFDGAATIGEAEIDGVPLNDVRVAFDGLYDASSGRGELHVPDATAQLAYGRVTARASAALAGGLSVDAHGNFADVNVHQLFKHWAGASQYGSGKMTGTFTLAGRNAQSINDLTGTLAAKLRDAQASTLPLAQTLQSYLAGGLSPSTRFGNGDLRARLARGVVRIQRLSLSSANLQLFVEGAVSLAGRLNLSVVANTGQINFTPALLLIAARLSTLVSPPIGLLLEANQFLSNQVVYLDVTGTVRAPTIRIKPLPMLEEEAIRFFLLESPLP